MEQYHDLLKRVLGHGDVQFEPRTQEYVLGISAWLSVYDLREGFPLITTKKVPPRFPFEELFWKLRGERNVKPLFDRDIHIWDANAFQHYLKRNDLTEKFPKHSSEWNAEFEKYKDRLAGSPEFAEVEGDLGPVYGYQWRHWEGKDGKETDQLTRLLKGIKERPGSRYHVLNAWNVDEIPNMALGPCPFWHQFSVFGEKMDLTMIQRSCDVFLGVPFNIAQDSLLAHMVAQETGFQPRIFNHSYINTHAYLGVPPRSDFWIDENNVKEFQDRFGNVKERSEYLSLRDWYLKNTPDESKGNKKKDHIPFILEQLSKEPKILPQIQLKEDVTLLEAIQMKPMDFVTIQDYDPHKWDSRASMAA